MCNGTDRNLRVRLDVYNKFHILVSALGPLYPKGTLKGSYVYCSYLFVVAKKIGKGLPFA